eukprot:1187602-Prorocentrum_minimum.AAC.4
MIHRTVVEGPLRNPIRGWFIFLFADLLMCQCANVPTCFRSTHMEPGQDFPFLELFMSLLFTVGAAVGMEMYARLAHKHWWHESWMWALPEEWRAEWNKPFWKLHESHHEPREGAFESNDIFAVANAVPAIALIIYGFLHGGMVPGMCFGAGLGITIFGIACVPAQKKTQKKTHRKKTQAAQNRYI